MEFTSAASFLNSEKALNVFKLLSYYDSNFQIAPEENGNSKNDYESN